MRNQLNGSTIVDMVFANSSPTEGVRAMETSLILSKNVNLDVGMYKVNYSNLLRTQWSIQRLLLAKSSVTNGISPPVITLWSNKF